MPLRRLSLKYCTILYSSQLKRRCGTAGDAAWPACRPLRSVMRNRTAAQVLAATVLALSVSLASAQSAQQFPPINIGTATPTPLSVQVTIPQAGTIAGMQVVSEGVPNADFIDATGGSCAIGNSYLAGQKCTVNVLFQPKYPGEHRGAVVLTLSGGGVLASRTMEGFGNGAIGILVPGLISTVVGDGKWIYLGDGVAATSAPIFLPMGVVTDTVGNLYLSDSSNYRIRKVDGSTGLISTIAGNGNPGFSGDNGLAINATLSNPSAIVLDGAGNVYFADSGNAAVRMINATTKTISTVAGIGGQQGYTGDSGPATAATLNSPSGLAIDANGDLYIADTGNNVIRKLTISTGIITTIAGTGAANYTGDNGPATAATLNSPWGLAFAGDGTLYFADLTNNAIRSISPAGIISTVVGTGAMGFSGDGGPATAAVLDNPAAVVVDLAGNIYIGDSGNNRIRKVLVSNGNIETISGGATEAFTGDGGNADQAGLYGPYSLFLDGQGNLFICDMFHNRIREISSNTALLQYAPIRVNRVSAPQPETYENDGNLDLNLTTLGIGNNAALDSATSTCASGQALAVGTSCALGVEFAPSVVGTNVTGTINLTSDAPTPGAVINLIGNSLTVDPTSITLASSANPSALAASVTFTAKVTTQGATVTGTVQLLDGNTVIGTATLNASGTATFTISSLALGSHNLTASYLGDSNNAPSTSTVLTQTVKNKTALALQSSLNPSSPSASVTFTATLTGATGSPTGPITFSDGSKVLGTGSLSSAGVATFTLSTLTGGSHSITASFAGDTVNLNNKSPVLNQVVSLTSTVTTLATSNGTIPVGVSVTFTATVANASGPTPTGSVTFKDGSTTLGTGTLNVSGIATFTSTTISPGSRSITAVYPGDANNGPSMSVGLTETVQQIGTSTIVTSGANPVSAGVALNLTATVTAAGGATSGGVFSGTVTFKDAGAMIGTAPVSEGGVATLPVSTLSVAQHTLTAVYAGNANYVGSTSPALSQTVQQATTSIILTSVQNPSVAGKGVTLSVGVTSTASTGGGTVTFHDGSTIIGQATLDSSGNGTLTVPNLPIGLHNITATYNGDPNNLTSGSNPLTQTVQIATTNISLSTSLNPVTAGVPITISATLTGNGGAPSGSILFQDGTTTIGTVAISSSGSFNFVPSSLSVGTHSLTATYTGDTNNATSTSAVITEVVQQASTTTALISSQNPSALNQSLTFTANVSGGNLVATGSISFQDGANVIGTDALNASGVATFTTSTLALGTHPIIAVYSGDVNHATSKSSTLNQQVLQATTISLGSSLNPSTTGKTVTFTVSLQGVAGLVPSGTVTFKDGGTVLTVATLDGTGTAAYSTSSLAVGSHPITATYSGDTNYQVSTSAILTQIVQIAATNIAISSDSNPALLGAPVTFSATLTGTGGSPLTGTVMFEDGTAVLGQGTLSNSDVATYTTISLTPGMHSITAVYSGDSNNSPNTSAALQQQVRQPTTNTLASNINPSLRLDQVVLTSTVTNGSALHPTGSVTFTEGAVILGTVALDATGTATLSLPNLTTGSHNIIATYSGDVGDVPSGSNPMVQPVSLRPTTDVLSATTTSSAGGQQVTLISVVRWTGPVSPTGTVTFMSGSTILGTTTVDSTGVATLAVALTGNQANLTASYGGDSVYATSTSSATSVTGQLTTQFTITVNPNAVTLQTKQHTTLTATITSIQGFTDTLALGCLGLPFAATCTFSTDRPALASNATQTVTIVLDSGSPLLAGPVASAKNSGPDATSKTLLCFMPLGGLLSLLLFRPRSRRLVSGLLMLLCGLGLTVGISGCGLNINGTPPGSYTFNVTAAGVNTGATQSAVVTLKVTP